MRWLGIDVDGTFTDPTLYDEDSGALSVDRGIDDARVSRRARSGPSFPAATADIAAQPESK
ncbi:MAG: hypothetical protein ACREFB_08885 [Stellaceae bacterium]